MADSIFLHDGVVFDLTKSLLSVTGVEWRWTGLHTDDGQPLMQSRMSANYDHRDMGPYDQAPLTLPDVYRDHGPFLVLPDTPTVSAAGFEGVAA